MLSILTASGWDLKRLKLLHRRSTQPNTRSNTMNILQINSSARSNGSESTRLADALVAKISAANPGAAVTRRDLAAQPHPVLDEVALQALFTPADQRNAQQATRVALDDALIA